MVFLQNDWMELRAEIKAQNVSLNCYMHVVKYLQVLLKWVYDYINITWYNNIQPDYNIIF